MNTCRVCSGTDPLKSVFGNAQKRERKRIKLRKNLKPSTDVSKLAGDVMKKCKYVHASKRDELERVIQELQHQVHTAV